ncbi:MAG: Prenyltransferase and squalene oxidase repeat protein [Planctomycetes bacterium ADurb.Bin069]|nr:MAG: Prenyltransferase and squalene oxidase repeat protein [Planctomycetes bacterium ADurb.Bin069]
MRRAARRAPALLRDAAPRVGEFLESLAQPDGGFRGRADGSDLYYTAFGLSGLLALGREFDRAAVARYARGFGAGEGLDLAHLACLARVAADCGLQLDDAMRDAILARVAGLRAADGGFGSAPGAARGTAYGAFLALGIFQDLGREVSGAAALIAACLGLRAEDGGFGNEPGRRAGATPATAAALTVLAELGAPAPPEACAWLCARCDSEGGFYAVAGAPVPDLLSTATALHALASAGAALDRVREPCVEYVDSLWSPRGGFRGHALDDALDSEYTFYALLALGHLSS